MASEKVLYMARDKNGILHLFSEKPFRNAAIGKWTVVNAERMQLPRRWYPEVRWAALEPVIVDGFTTVS